MHESTYLKKKKKMSERPDNNLEDLNGDTHPFEVLDSVSVPTDKHHRFLSVAVNRSKIKGTKLARISPDILDGTMKWRNKLNFAIVGLFLVVLGLTSIVVWDIVQTEVQRKEIKQLRDANEELQLKMKHVGEKKINDESDVILHTLANSTNVALTSMTSLKTRKTTVATTTHASGMTNNIAFAVLQSKEVNYTTHRFLAVQVQVPSDGLSKSENWCREYQYLCENFSRRPTGCGIFSANVEYKLCSDLYNSDRDIDNVLGCNPSRKIAEIANIAFPNLTTPAEAHRNSFGFYACNSVDCTRTIEGSWRSVHIMQDFWEKGQRTMYTVCH